jgi:ATP-dependent helicase/nuclease subunit A
VTPMTDSLLPIDHQERERALDPQRSFIVQAPAGSGKTHLLIQRFLKLLTCVDEPEQIIAITFTVKAAGEMRERVLEALERARQGVEPTAAHEISMAELASAAVARDRRRGWDLEHFPARLRVTTIDALNRQLSSAAPLIAGGLSLNAIATEADTLYAQAANRLLNWMTEPGAIGDAVKAILRHLDNNVDRFESLIAQMLAQREQWLPILGTGALGSDAEQQLLQQRHELEACLAEIVGAKLVALDALLPLALKQELVELMAFSVAQLKSGKYSQIAPDWEGLQAFPKPAAEALLLWQELSNLFLTKDNAWRKTIRVNEGFPAKTPEKERLLAVLAELIAADKDGSFLEILVAVRGLPPAAIDEQQWQVLGHLLVVLPLAVIELRDVFREQGEADFSEVAIEARAALGRSDQPSDLALAMDCKLQHILLDEFQDTSVSQYELLKLLIRGWVPGDGRSLFLVGDPMQSIYRFRQAEVSNFLEVAAQGIHTGEGYWFKPEPLRLQANFRSAPAVVDWVNTSFARVLPEHNDVLTGAVKFSASVANKPADACSGIHWHVLSNNSLDAEAEQVVQLVDELLQGTETAGESIGILVRSRRHAAGIANLLRTRGIEFAGKDLEHMADIPLVQDLLSLTRALLHPADRLAWTALLRAPWCGLLLADLHALLAADRKAPVWQLLNAEDLPEKLSTDAGQRVAKLVAVLTTGFSRRGRLPLCDWIEGVWHSLGGPACAREANELLAAEAYFRFLEDETDSDDIADTAELLGKLEAKPVSFSNPDALVQIMTVHKAKGLEFDSVILPSLGRSTRRSDKPVLAWKQVIRPSGDTGLLLAPVEQYGAGADPLFDFIAQIDAAQEAAERARLLYVAVTRARKRLYPFVALKQDKNEQTAGPAKNSLAYCMLDIISEELPLPAQLTETPKLKTGIWLQPDLQRFVTAWRPPEPAAAVASALKHAIHVPAEPVTFDWASPLARVVGTVVHEYLEQMSADGRDSVNYSAEVCSALLAEQGVTEAELAQGVQRVTAALDNACTDATARWLLSAEHISAASELAITLCQNGLTTRKVVDRTFVTPDGDRWIIDYKTSVHRGSDTDAFVDNEVERYREQLEGYRAAMLAVYPAEATQVRLGLYFPGLNVFREVV